MSYRENVHAVAVALAELVRDGAQVDAGDLDAALTARNGVLELLRTMHYSATGMRRYRHVEGAPGVERHPVAALGRALRRQPVIPSTALSEVVAAHPTSTAARRWRHAARHAALAAHELTGSRLGVEPDRDAAWAEVADIAALADGFAVATADLAGVARDAGRQPLAVQLQLAGTSGLQTAARAAARLATSGPTPQGVEPLRPPPTLVLPVRDVRDVSAGLHRLAHLVAAAREISPAHVQLLARALAVAAQDASAVLAAAGPEYAAGVEALNLEVRALARVTSASRRLAAIVPSDDQPLEQARAVHRALTTARDAREPLTERQALAVAHAVADATKATGRAARHQVDTLRWFTPIEGAEPGGTEWHPALRSEAEPALFIHLRAAVRRARQADRRLPVLPAPAPKVAWPSPREVLAGALAARRNAAPGPRPATPSIAPMRVR